MPSPVRDNNALSRFELDVDGATAVAHYRLADGIITLTHTEVPPELGGRGVGTTLVKGALEAARARGLRVKPLCPFVCGYVERHPEFQDLLA